MSRSQPGQSLFWVDHGPSSTEHLLGSLEAIRDRALLFGCPWTIRYRAYFLMSKSQQGQSLFWVDHGLSSTEPLLGSPEALRDRALLVGCTWAIRYRASWVWVIKSPLN